MFPCFDSFHFARARAGLRRQQLCQLRPRPRARRTAVPRRRLRLLPSGDRGGAGPVRPPARWRDGDRQPDLRHRPGAQHHRIRRRDRGLEPRRFPERHAARGFAGWWAVHAVVSLRILRRNEARARRGPVRIHQAVRPQIRPRVGAAFHAADPPHLRQEPLAVLLRTGDLQRRGGQRTRRARLGQVPDRLRRRMRGLPHAAQFGLHPAGRPGAPGRDFPYGRGRRGHFPRHDLRPRAGRVPRRHGRRNRAGRRDEAQGHHGHRRRAAGRRR